MDLSKIKEKFDLEGILTLKVSGWDQKQFPLIHSEGSFESFFNLIKALEIKFVYLQEGIFSEEFFEIDPDFLNSESYDVEINLIENPELKKFAKYFGSTPYYHFLVAINNHFVDHLLMEEWFKEFCEAVQNIKENAKLSFFESIERQNENEEKLMEELNNIIKSKLNDSAFTNCKTKQVMLEYAIEKYPELSNYEENLIREAISNNYSKIKARKLLNKN